VTTESFIEEFEKNSTIATGLQDYRNWQDCAQINIESHPTRENCIAINGFFAMQPVGSGAGTKTINYLKELANKHDVTLVTYALTLSQAYSNDDMVQWYSARGFQKNGLEDVDLGYQTVELERMEYASSHQAVGAQ